MSIFSSFSLKRAKRSRFNMSHAHTTAAGMGQLIPGICREIIPSDKWKLKNNITCRAIPMITPVMHPIDIRAESMFVPCRLLFTEFEDFITGGDDGTLEPVTPQILVSDLKAYGDLRNTMYDYLGLPLDPKEGGCVINDEITQIEAMPFLACYLIYNEYYRDPNLDEDRRKSFPFPPGPIPAETLEWLLPTKTRCYEKDYFTAALPWAQRGPQVTIPLGDEASVRLRDADGTAQTVQTVSEGLSPQPGAINIAGSPTSLQDIDNQMVNLDPNGTLYVDLADATAVSVNDLRRASAIQRWLEANARGGGRYIEQLLSHFGVISSDARLQRPEFLQSSRTPLFIQEIRQTSGSNISGQDTPQGNLSGYAIGGGFLRGGRRYFEEWGFVVQFISVVPRTRYQFGLERMWTRSDKLAYAWPELARLGEQEVYNYELDATHPDPKGIFGYQPRYSDYKYILSRTTGEAARTLSPWQMARDLSGTNPALSSDFVHINQADYYKNFAAGAQSENQQFILDFGYHISAVRPLPKSGTPILI